MRGSYFKTTLLSGNGDEHGTDAHDRWVVSYADFITLMFAFFVVMYSISSVNDGKFRVLSQTMLNVFRNPEVVAAVEEELLARAADKGRVTASALDSSDAFEPEALARLAALRPDELDGVLKKVLAGQIDAHNLTVSASADWTEIELPGDFLIDPSSGEIAADAAAPVGIIARLAQALEVPVRVEGFTDNVPPSDPRYASNRVQSAAQAAAVADALSAAGLASEQIAASAFGELHPLASNATATGRARNRRVVIAVARHGQVTPAAASLAARPTPPEQLPERALTRISELPGPTPASL